MVVIFNDYVEFEVSYSSIKFSYEYSKSKLINLIFLSFFSTALHFTSIDLFKLMLLPLAQCFVDTLGKRVSTKHC